MDYPILGYYLPFVKKAPVKSSSYSLPALIYFILDMFKVFAHNTAGCFSGEGQRWRWRRLRFSRGTGRGGAAGKRISSRSIWLVSAWVEEVLTCLDLLPESHLLRPRQGPAKPPARSVGPRM